MSPSASGSSIVAAATWIEQLLTGGLATTVAVLAVAGVGFRLLTGELALRRALTVVLGIFILFGAPTLVRELTAAARGDAVAAPDASVPSSIHPPSAPKVPPAADPYAGAAVPG